MPNAARWRRYLRINAYWFALTVRAQVLGPIVVPLLVQRFVGEAQKGTYLGTIRMWALMAAVLTQAVMGAVSDRSTSKWGRRRPFILAGTIAQLAIVTLIGLSAQMEGLHGYGVLFVLYILSMVASDTAHAATQGLMPDLVPEAERGMASGIKALLEVPLPLLLVSLIVGPLVSQGRLWGGLVCLMVVLIACAAVVLTVQEKRALDAQRVKADLVLRAVLMTGVFALIILGAGAVVNAVLALPLDVSPRARLVAVGAAGGLGMVGAVVCGVLVSVRIGVGRDARAAPGFTWWVINRLAFMVAANGLSGFMLYFMQERFTALFGEKAAGPVTRAMMLVGIAILVAAVPSGWLADRVGKKPLVAASGILATLGMSVLLLIPALSTVYVGGTLIGLAVGMFYSANWALGTTLIPRQQAGRYLGLSNLAGAGAGAIGAYIGGPIADSHSYVLVYAIYGALFLLSTLALGGIQEPGGASAGEGRLSRAM